MRNATLGLVGMMIAGCGGAIDAPAEVLAIDAARHGREAGAERPIVGTLRMRDRDVPLTPEALEARGNEALREMTAQPTATPVMADIDDQYLRTAVSEPADLLAR